MQMNANLILAGQTPDVMGAYQSGAMMGEQENEWSRQNALRQLYREQGAGILSGDPAALNALAGMDPQAAMGAKQAQLQMQSTQQGMAIDQERLAIARQQAAREATQWAQTQDAATVAQQRDKLASGLKGAAYFHQQGDPVGYENYLMQQGIDPTQVPFDQFPAYAATMEGVLEAWNSFAPNSMPKGMPADIAALQWRADAAGLKPGTPEYQNFILTGGRGDDGKPAAFLALHEQALAAGFAEGSPEYKNFMATRGAGLAEAAKVRDKATAEAAIAAPADISTADRTIDYIDEVRNHPGLDWGTGFTSQGNIIAGTPGYDFQNRVKQLASGAFMTAIDELRGMGALSNAEGQTATAAVTRMDTATSKDEFIDALDDYEAVVKLGRDRAVKRIAPNDGAASVPPPANTSGRLRYNPETGDFE